ncbi:hypothetical protein AKJ50_01480 [candidate division MSBL1 archaeon SCGC-AAA382A13]|uniref:Methyltransferase small domain-containing protein n=1 Tax=candidate division MSBL1 archaeon SCGC-AAA382A13 TaxID=1698279 RepID=A0A133VFQ3_9EURY|nr:hypothetical protein AKJ50_01480 [candidate division MSBL1 archaeon SCGC-AAA382A13]
MFEVDSVKKKELEIKLQNLEAHSNPKPELEQYMTPGDIAASLLYLAYSHGSIKGKKVYDLGCGTGRLAIGAALLGAEKVVGIEIDEEALEVAKRNARQSNVDVKWVCADVGKIDVPEFNSVIQNPPFGVQKKGADMVFLKKAIQLGKEVYSIHKAVLKNRDFISEQVKEQGGKITHRIEKEFHIPGQFKFHTRKIYRFKVDLYRIIRR